MKKGGLKQRARKQEDGSVFNNGAMGGRRTENDAFVHNSTVNPAHFQHHKQNLASGPQNGPETHSDQHSMSSSSSSSSSSMHPPLSHPRVQQQLIQPQNPQNLQKVRANSSELALSQKNHRLAKELSELRVRHREETKVVSRLTMENMNLASRCREAISQVAALKKEILMYQKRQGEWQLRFEQLQAQQRQVMQAVGNKTLHQINGANRSNADRHVSPTHGTEKTSLESKGSNSPTTDLDRIMSQKFKKQESIKSSPDGATEKKDVQSMVRKFQEMNVSTQVPSTNSSGKSSGSGSSGASKRSQLQISTNPPPPPPKVNDVVSSNVKVPISVTSNTAQNDDEFDADIDMVDFFAKSQAALNSSSSSDAITNSSRIHSRKSKGSDDIMPSDVVSPPFSPSGTQRKQLGDTLLSSLDAFEASFASAFPETSFSISESPSSASLDMAFDIPDFGDPFFKSSTGSDTGSQGSREGKLGRPGHLETLRSGGNSATGGNPSKNGIKSQIQNLFPESAMNFKTSPTQNPLFDSPMAFTPMEITSSDKGKTAPVAPEKLESAFSRAQYDMTLNRDSSKSGASTSSKEERSQRRPFPGRTSSTPLSPQSMSAEIQQLDAIANLASTEKSDLGTNPAPAPRRKLRNVKQPVSYAEPSLSAKLRRGDVLFPKVDAEKKYLDTDIAAKNPEEVLKDLETVTLPTQANGTLEL